MSELDFIDPRETPYVEPAYRGELPHLYKDGGTYFVTFRLWDAVVSRKYGPTSFFRTASQLEPEAIAQSTEPPLRLGSCPLSNPACANIVEGAMIHFQGERFALGAWCIMPNHVHAVFQPLGEFSPSTILHGWKSFSAHKINKMLHRAGTVWERESFDHLARSVDEVERFIDYVEENPVTAGLCESSVDWPWSSARVRFTAKRVGKERTP